MISLYWLYNGVDLRRLDELAASPVADPWFESDAPAVLMAVGRLAPQKDFRNLLEAFARVRSRRGVRLVILGKDRNAPGWRAWRPISASRPT